MSKLYTRTRFATSVLHVSADGRWTMPRRSSPCSHCGFEHYDREMLFCLDHLEEYYHQCQGPQWVGKVDFKMDCSVIDGVALDCEGKAPFSDYGFFEFEPFEEEE